MKKIILIIFAIFAAFVLLSTCSQSTPKDTQKQVEKTAQEVADQVTNVADAENEYVLAVKNGTNMNYPDRTYGEAFEQFFSYPTWKYFNGTLEGPDDDNDGEPDYVEEDIDVVEFTGYCMYHDTEVKVRLQFQLDLDAGTFDTGAMSFNDVPQSQLMTAALLQAAFEGGTDDSSSSKNDTTEEITADEGPVYSDDFMVSEDPVDVHELAGEYGGFDGECSISIFTSDEDDGSVGEAEIHTGGKDYSGTMFEYATNVYEVITKEGDSLYIGAQVNGESVNLSLQLHGEIIDYFVMTSPYVS